MILIISYYTIFVVRTRFPAVEGIDEVPNAHSLTGFIIALDFLGQNFTEVKLRQYFTKAHHEAEVIYNHTIITKENY